MFDWWRFLNDWDAEEERVSAGGFLCSSMLMRGKALSDLSLSQFTDVNVVEKKDNISLRGS